MLLCFVQFDPSGYLKNIHDIFALVEKLGCPYSFLL